MPAVGDVYGHTETTTERSSADVNVSPTAAIITPTTSRPIGEEEESHVSYARKRSFHQAGV